MVIYTSGTTGRPKGAVHVHCGFPIKAAQDLAHCFDLQGDDMLFWFTDLGWMMGPVGDRGRPDCWAAPSSSTTARPTIPGPTGSGRWWSGTA